MGLIALDLLRGGPRDRRREDAARLVKALPAYQVALWPDGWEHLAGGGVLVRDTDAMAEARRWYELAERNRGVLPMDRVMGLHGTFVPRPVVSLSGHRFTTAEAASVAFQLVAGDWIRQRRERLLRSPGLALSDRLRAWSGSRCEEACDAATAEAVLSGLLTLCIAERLIPAADYRLRVQGDDRFGVRGFRCLIEVYLEPYACQHICELIAAGMIPWNRTVARDRRSHPLIGIEIRRPSRAI